MKKNGSARRPVPDAAIYVRLSRDREGQTALDRQEEDCRAWAKQHGLEVVRVFTDLGKSGYKDVRREGFDDALRALESGEVGTLLVWKLDRLSRRGIGQVGQVLDRLEASGGRIVAVQDNLDTSHQQARIVIALLAELARAESTNTGVRVSNAKQALRRKGKWHGGAPPYGLRRRGEDGHLEPDPERAPVVRRIVTEALEGRSLRSIAQGLTADGVPAPRGNRWAASTVSKILRSPVLAGSLGRDDDGEIIECPALMSPGEAAKVAALIEARSVVDREGRPRGARRPARALLTGLIRCGHCGASMTADLKRGRYACSGRAAGRLCPGNVVNAGPVEDMVTQRVLSQINLLDPDDPLFVEVARRWTAATDPATAQERRAREIALEDAQARLAALEDARWLRGEFDGREDRYEVIRAKLEAQVRTAEAALAARPVDVDVNPLIHALERRRDSWRTVPLEDRRAVLALLLDAVLVRKAAGFGPRFNRRRVWIKWFCSDFPEPCIYEGRLGSFDPADLDAEEWEDVA